MSELLLDVVIVFVIDGFFEIQFGDDLVVLFGDVFVGWVEEGDILVIISKVVSKVEGCIIYVVDWEDVIIVEICCVVVM